VRFIPDVNVIKIIIQTITFDLNCSDYIHIDIGVCILNYCIKLFVFADHSYDVYNMSSVILKSIYDDELFINHYNIERHNLY
jgi:hypothetical protein